MADDSAASTSVDGKFVQELAAANGLALTPERAADLIPAVRAILDADAQLATLDLSALPAAGLPWAARREE